MLPAKNQNRASKTSNDAGNIPPCFSKASWDSEKGMAEVFVQRGKIWNTTGVNRSASLLCHIEEVIFLMEQRRMIVTSGMDIMTLQDAYDLLTVEDYGCSWDGYLVYAYLKGLGYIVKRNGIPWTLSKKALEATHQSSESLGTVDNHEGCVNSDLKLKLTFDVYPPNGCFKKKCPGSPAFSIFVMRLHPRHDISMLIGQLSSCSDQPPSLKEVVHCEAKSKGVPVKFASVVCGHITIFDIKSAALPELP